MDKAQLKAELVQHLAAELEAAERAQRTTIEGATHEEAKPENDKDTRALEQSYLARGQAVRVEELRNGLLAVTAMVVRDCGEDAAVAVGTVMEVIERVVGSDEELALTLFLAPHGGGARLALGQVQVVTHRSPLGRVLVGMRAGDEAELELGGRKRSIELLRVL